MQPSKTVHDLTDKYKEATQGATPHHAPLEQHPSTAKYRGEEKKEGEK